MARLWSSGAELNTVTNDVEFSAKLGSGTTSIDSAIKRSNTYSMKIVASAQNGGGERFTYAAAAVEGAIYARTYFRIGVSSDQDNIGIVRTLGGGTSNVEIRMMANDTLILYNNEDSAQIGSASSALSLDTWYRIELKVDSATKASTEVEARIDGTAFASGTINLADGNNAVDFFGIHVVSGFSHTGTYYHDDMAINDGTGSFQNSWPGAGEIIHLRPNAAGDNTAWNEGVGSTYAEVDEVTPDDGTTFIGDNDANVISDFNIDATPAALASDDTINCVHVGVRYQVVITGAPAEFVLRIKAAASGTVEESAAIVPNSTSWGTNANAVPRNYPLTLYDLPGASTTAWTKADLDTTQIGVRVSTANTWRAQVSTLWLLVDHTPTTVTSSVKDILGSGIIPFARS